MEELVADQIGLATVVAGSLGQVHRLNKTVNARSGSLLLPGSLTGTVLLLHPQQRIEVPALVFVVILRCGLVRHAPFTKRWAILLPCGLV